MVLPSAGHLVLFLLHLSNLPAQAFLMTHWVDFFFPRAEV